MHHPAPTAHHLPAGWPDPNRAPAQAPMSYTAPQTATRVRWGRLLLMIAGMVLIAFGGWSWTNSSSGTDDTSGTKTVSGGGGSELEVARSSRSGSLSEESSALGNEASTGAAADAVSTPRTLPTTRPRGTARARMGAGAGAAATARPAMSAQARAARAAGVRTVAGGGAAAPTELPYTGIETWIAAILGIGLLGLGICVQINAVRIGMTAMLYRRGILLRPIECARLAQSRGPARLHMMISDLLHRLLEEPARSSDFVSVRHTR